MDGGELKWKQIEVNDATDSRDLLFFMKWLIVAHPLQDEKAATAIKKTTNAGSENF